MSTGPFLSFFLSHPFPPSLFLLPDTVRSFIHSFIHFLSLHRASLTIRRLPQAPCEIYGSIPLPIAPSLANELPFSFILSKDNSTLLVLFVKRVGRVRERQRERERERDSEKERVSEKEWRLLMQLCVFGLLCSLFSSKVAFASTRNICSENQK